MAFLCANVLENQVQWREKNPKEEQSRIRKQCANRRLMADDARKPTRIGSIKDIGL